MSPYGRDVVGAGAGPQKEGWLIVRGVGVKIASPSHKRQDLPLVLGLNEERVQGLTKELFPFEGGHNQMPFMAGVSLPLTGSKFCSIKHGVCQKLDCGHRFV